MKKTRFFAVIEGLVDKTKYSIRQRSVDNILNTSDVNHDTELQSIEEQKLTLLNEIATGDSAEVPAKLQQMAEIFLREREIKIHKEITQQIRDYINQEIETSNE